MLSEPFLRGTSLRTLRLLPMKEFLNFILPLFPSSFRFILIHILCVVLVVQLLSFPSFDFFVSSYTKIFHVNINSLNKRQKRIFHFVSTQTIFKRQFMDPIESGVDARKKEKLCTYVDMKSWVCEDFFGRIFTRRVPVEFKRSSVPFDRIERVSF